jgi:hypothetical protein
MPLQHAARSSQAHTRPRKALHTAPVSGRTHTACVKALAARRQLYYGHAILTATPASGHLHTQHTKRTPSMPTQRATDRECMQAQPIGQAGCSCLKSASAASAQHTASERVGAACCSCLLNSAHCRSVSRACCSYLLATSTQHAASMSVNHAAGGTAGTGFRRSQAAAPAPGASIAQPGRSTPASPPGCCQQSGCCCRWRQPRHGCRVACPR